MAARKSHVDEIVGWVDRVFGFSFDGWTHKDFTFRDDYSADFVVRFGNATPRRFVLVSKDAFSTLDYIAVYETTESPAMGKSLDGPLYRRLWARLVCRGQYSKRPANKSDAMEPNQMVCDTPTALRFFASAGNKVEADLMRKAADEIERLRMTPEERETVTGLAAYCETRATINFQRWSSTLWLLLARSDSAKTVMQR